MKVSVISLQERAKVEAKGYVEQLLAEGARKLLQAAIENEVSEYLRSQSTRRTESGERTVVRNGHLPERDLVTGMGPVKIRQPRVRHRDDQFSGSGPGKGADRNRFQRARGSGGSGSGRCFRVDHARAIAKGTNCRLRIFERLSLFHSVYCISCIFQRF